MNKAFNLKGAADRITAFVRPPRELLTFPLKALLSEDADQSQELCDLFQVKYRSVVELDDGQRALVIGAAAAVVQQPARKESAKGDKHPALTGTDLRSPVDAGHVEDDVDHVTAQFVGLHVHRGAVCGDVNLADDVKQEGLLDPGVLQKQRGGHQRQGGFRRRVGRPHGTETYRYENVQKVLQSGQLRNELLDDLTEGLEDGVIVDAGQVEAEDGERES